MNKAKAKKEKARRVPRSEWPAPLSRVKKKWTPHEESILVAGWGVFKLDLLAERLGRTPAGVLLRAEKMGIGAAGRGTISLTEMSRLLGYDPGTIKLVMRRLGLSAKRVPSTNLRAFRGGRAPQGKVYALDEDDMDLIVAELNRQPDPNRIQETFEGEWGTGTKPDACLRCKGTTKPHLCRGLCNPCYCKSKSDGTLHRYPPIKRGTVGAKKKPKKDEAQVVHVRPVQEAVQGSSGLAPARSSGTVGEGARADAASGVHDSVGRG